MGGATWADNLDGTFNSPPFYASRGYSWHELYIMGLAEPGEVEDWFYIRDPDPMLPAAYWPPDGSEVTGERVDVGVDQIIQALGPRIPPARLSRKDKVSGFFR